jgi:hypothetical protein
VEAPSSLARFSLAAITRQLQTISVVRLNPTAPSISSSTLMVGAKSLDQSRPAQDDVFWPNYTTLVYTMIPSKNIDSPECKTYYLDDIFANWFA